MKKFELRGKFQQEQGQNLKTLQDQNLEDLYYIRYLEDKVFNQDRWLKFFAFITIGLFLGLLFL